MSSAASLTDSSVDALHQTSGAIGSGLDAAQSLKSTLDSATASLSSAFSSSASSYQVLAAQVDKLYSSLGQQARSAVAVLDKLGGKVDNQLSQYRAVHLTHDQDELALAAHVAFVGAHPPPLHRGRSAHERTARGGKPFEHGVLDVVGVVDDRHAERQGVFGHAEVVAVDDVWRPLPRRRDQLPVYLPIEVAPHRVRRAHHAARRHPGLSRRRAPHQVERRRHAECLELRLVRPLGLVADEGMQADVVLTSQHLQGVVGLDPAARVEGERDGFGDEQDPHRAG